MPERYVRSGEARLWTCSTGAGTPFLMFNGGPGCDDYLAPVAAMIEDMCEVVRFEPRGCGRSDWDGRYDVDVEIAGAAHTVWLTHTDELRTAMREAVVHILGVG